MLKKKIILLSMVALALIAIFMLIHLNTSNLEYVLPRRGKKILAIVLTGAAIAFSTVVFQTITNNRILTPSILGLDSLYLLIQTVLIFFLGSGSGLMSTNVNFFLSVGLMVVFASVLYRLMFKREDQNIFLLLLVGIVFGSLFGSLSSFMQMLIDPNEFLIIQDRMFASFNNVNEDILIFSLIGFLLIGLYVIRFTKFFDVMSLGRDEAINLGIPYDKTVKKMLILIAVLVSISTALVGPIMFLGLLVVNLAREFLKTYRHTYLLMGSTLISVIALVGGLLIVERVFTFETTLSVIINFVGGTYFIYLLLKESKAW
ncbi:iron chelate uptake ABC transporter family permease subunit [Alkalihalobacillus sp. FSL R5-0424]